MEGIPLLGLAGLMCMTGIPTLQVAALFPAALGLLYLFFPRKQSNYN